MRRHAIWAVVAALALTVLLSIGPRHATGQFQIRSLNTGVWAWGWGDSGQLGDGSYSDRTRPIAVALAEPVAVAAGAAHTTHPLVHR